VLVKRILNVIKMHGTTIKIKDCESSREETHECSNIHYVSTEKYSAFDSNIFWCQCLQRTLINADIIFLYIMNRVPI
jgi:hypothetical protein